MALDIVEINKIHSICSHLQPRLLESVQILKETNKYRSGCLLTDKKKNNNSSCNFVYINIPNFNNWHKKIFEKRVKETTANFIIEVIKSEKLTRITFK